AGGALDRRVPSSGVCSGAPHPLTFGGTGKETGQPQARPNLGPLKLGCLTDESVFLRSPPRKRGPRAKLAGGKTGSPPSRGRQLRAMTYCVPSSTSLRTSAPHFSCSDLM